MSYVVLARKYRSANFAEMVGQEHVVQALGNALTQQRLHHAYLFTGTRGVGKTTVSRILAKALNCTGPDGQGGITATPCGQCASCRDIDAGRFVDYTELDAASNRGVDEVQALLEQAVYKPVAGRFKVFMIDEVHMLTNTAFNAMLKTLEEPPEYLKFVLATTDPQKVPVTVLSRCLQFGLRPMAPETVERHLADVLAREGVEAEPAALRLIARGARGSMRDALSLTDQAIAFGAGRIAEAGVRQMLGSADRSHVLGLIGALAAGDGRTVVETVDALRAQGLSAAATLEDMAAALQRMAVLQAVPGMAAGDDADAAELARLAAAMPPDETQLLYSLCLHGRGELGLAPDEYAAATMVLLRLLAFKPAGHAAAPEKKTLKSEPSRPAASAVAVSPGPAPAPPPAPAPVAALPPGRALPVSDRPVFGSNRSPASVPPPFAATKGIAVPVREQPEPGSRTQAPRDTAPLVTTPEGDHWAATVAALVAAEAITAMVRELALQAQLVARDGDHWMLRVERASLDQPTARERLRAALSQAGHAAQITVEVGTVTDSPSRRHAAASAARQQAAEAVILNDPFVQQMQRDWDARIVPGSVRPVDAVHT